MPQQAILCYCSNRGAQSGRLLWKTVANFLGENFLLQSFFHTCRFKRTTCATEINSNCCYKVFLAVLLTFHVVDMICTCRFLETLKAIKEYASSDRIPKAFLTVTYLLFPGVSSLPRVKPRSINTSFMLYFLLDTLYRQLVQF